MQWGLRRAGARFCLAIVVAGIVAATLVQSRAQPAPGEEAAVLASDTALGEAMRAGDKSRARRLLSLQFTYVDENGAVQERKAFLDDLKGLSADAATDVKVKIYGLVAVVSGKRKPAQGGEVFFLDIWAKQKNTWRTLNVQEVSLAATKTASARPDMRAVDTKSDAGSDAKPEAKAPECKNPCQTIPYRVRSPAEQDVLNAFQAIARATVAHDADEWSKHVGEEFVRYRSGRAPMAKSGGMAALERQKQRAAATTVSAVESMRLSVYGDGAAMIATHAAPSDAQPLFRAASVWAKRDGQWQLVISAETDIKDDNDGQ